MKIPEYIKISTKEFALLKKYIYDNIGISLSDQKVALLSARLNKRLFLLNFKTFMEYYEYLQNNTQEYTKFINAISTNVTYFFREDHHWKFLANNLDKLFKNQKKIRIWSSACSTGEEPYSMSIFLYEHLQNIEQFDIKILATDISHAAIAKAQKGIYLKEQIDDISSYYHLKKYFIPKEKDKLQIKQEIKQLVLFRTFNLVYGDYHIFKKTNFDIIFCRNVLIYFDEQTREKVTMNLVNQLRDGGYLFIGHSESLMSHKHLKYIAPSIYQKKGK